MGARRKPPTARGNDLKTMLKVRTVTRDEFVHHLDGDVTEEVKSALDAMIKDAQAWLQVGAGGAGAMAFNPAHIVAVGISLVPEDDGE